MDPPKDRKEGETSHLGAIVLLVMFGILAALVCGETWQALKALPPYVGRTLTEEETAEVIAGNSPLTSYVYLSPNADFPRNAKISKITIHHMAGQLTLEELGVSFAKRDRNASSNYGIDSSGKVGLYVEEANRSWASSNAENDHMAVTIEVANEEIGGSWKVSGEAYQTLIDLCADICRRNGIERLVYTGGPDGTLTAHKMFADTECPGPYLESRMAEIADAVNEKLEDEGSSSW